MTETTNITLAEELVIANQGLNKILGKHVVSEYHEYVNGLDISDEAKDILRGIIADEQNGQADWHRDFFRVDGLVARTQVAARRLNADVKDRW